MRSDFETFGQASTTKCKACDSTNTRLEPRYGYAVCIEHFRISPVELNKYVKCGWCKDRGTEQLDGGGRIPCTQCGGGF